jgi:hypothetical protein
MSVILTFDPTRPRATTAADSSFSTKARRLEQLGCVRGEIEHLIETPSGEWSSAETAERRAVHRKAVCDGDSGRAAEDIQYW